MQLADKSGISCDLCGGQHRYDFIYYSIDIRSVQVSDNVRPRLLASQPIISLDVCPSCWSALSSRITANYRAVASGLVCDLTGRHMYGNYEYYDCEVTKATVRFLGTKASVSTEPRFVELALSPEAYEELKQKLLDNRKAASIWSSTVDSHPSQNRSNHNTIPMR